MKDLTQGSVLRHILAMAAPIAFGMIFQTLYYLVDLYFVAGLGEAALAGVSAAGNVMFIIIGLTQVLGVGTVALIAHAVGRKDQPDANLIFNQSLVLSALCAAAYVHRGLHTRRPVHACRRRRCCKHRCRHHLPVLVHPLHGAAVRARCDGFRPAWNRHRSADDGRADRDRGSEYRPRSGADRGLGYGAPDRRGGGRPCELDLGGGCGRNAGCLLHEAREIRRVSRRLVEPTAERVEAHAWGSVCQRAGSSCCCSCSWA